MKKNGDKGNHGVEDGEAKQEGIKEQGGPGKI